MTRSITCIICPRGCALSAEIEGENVSVVGNACAKGRQYAIDECIHPLRTVTSTVRVKNRENTMVSVKTDGAVPKDKIFEVMRQIRDESVCAPVHIGDIIVRDVFGTCIVATQNIE